jgi:hypothetical protein
MESKMTRKLFIFAILLLGSIPAFGQHVDTAWVRRYNGPAYDYDFVHSLTVDGVGNVYITGYSYGGSTGYDYATIKYYPNGDTAWVRRYNEPGNLYDEAYDIVADGSGNVYVTGTSGTIKYGGDGNQLWIKSWHGYAMATDGSGNIYVTGASVSVVQYADYITTKYYPNGDTAWVRRYNGPGNGRDQANTIAVDGLGNVYVSGKSTGVTSSYDYATVKYYPNGDTVWVRRYNGPADDWDEAFAISVDGSGNVYVTGCSYGNMGWYDYATIKYYSNGDTAWVRRYNGPGNSRDEASAIAINGSGDVYVTGGSLANESFFSYDYATIKYYPNGDTAWLRRYDGWGGTKDSASAIAIDASGNIYVTGKSYGASYDYVTIKYDPNGNELWVRRYNGPASNEDLAYDIAIDTYGNPYVNVYVTGRSYGIYTDYATIKYSQFECGDANCDGRVSISDIVWLINYLFKGGPPPCPIIKSGDVNCDGVVTVSDITYLNNYLFKGGPPPCDTNGDGVPDCYGHGL